MIRRAFAFIRRGVVFAAAFSLVFGTSLASASEQTELPEWSVFVGGGFAFHEQDEPNYGGQLYETRISYTTSPRWSFEGSLGVFPFFEGRDFADRTFSTGLNTTGENWGLKGSADVLYHFNKDPERKWDPFMILGGGVTWLKKEVNDNSWDPFAELGVGITHQLNQAWSVRMDARTVVIGKNTEFNEHVMAYLGYRWGGSGDAVAEGEGLFDDEGKMRKLQTIYFDFDKSVLTEESQEKLRQNADWLKAQENAGKKVVVEGHCDERGTQEYNYALGERRAQSAYDYYRSLGVPQDKMSTVSFGEDNPVDPASNEEAWRKNRRAETVVSPE